MTRLIGLDHGRRRIGVAVADTDTGMAFARAAIRRRSVAVDLAAIEGLVTEEGATVVVIGLPLNMDGSEGEQAAAARAFGGELARIGLVIAFADERLSSWEAGEHLRESGRRPKRESGEIDSTAARGFLQEYLDTRQWTGPPEETE